MFYGWYIVIASVFLTAYNEWATYYGFTAFIKPLADAFGWSYAQISLAMSLRGMQSGLLSPLLGMLVDRWPARRLIIMGVVILGLGYLALSRVTNLTSFYISFLIIGLGGSGMYLIPMTTAVRWFRRNLGKAIGVLSLGAGIGGSFLPVLVRMIDNYGWQTSLVILAAGVWLLGIPLAFVFRSRPEDYGLLPDGKRQGDLSEPSGSNTYEFSVGVKEALKMRAFWQMAAAFMLQLAAVMAVLTHVMPYLASLGVAKSTASMVAMIAPLVSLGGRVLFGWLADIFSKKYLCAAAMVITSISLLLFWLVDGSSLPLMILFAIFFGFSLSGIIPLRAPIFREYFGTRRFATISGLAGTFSMMGMVTGPPLAGWVFDTLGFYDPIWLILSAAPMVGAILMFTMPQPAETPNGSLTERVGVT